MDAGSSDHLPRTNKRRLSWHTDLRPASPPGISLGAISDTTSDIGNAALPVRRSGVFITATAAPLSIFYEPIDLRRSS